MFKFHSLPPQSVILTYQGCPFFSGYLSHHLEISAGRASTELSRIIFGIYLFEGICKKPHLLVQMRARLLNGELKTRFAEWYPGFDCHDETDELKRAT
ncbi:hypothetical protein NOC27_3413 [Nitrosococcus oceani AFC27]|nr:hypothetical protein NOC27_3413 [Nitrosococcus oceani AFC27]